MSDREESDHRDGRGDSREPSHASEEGDRKIVTYQSRSRSKERSESRSPSVHKSKKKYSRSRKHDFVTIAPQVEEILEAQVSLWVGEKYSRSSRYSRSYSRSRSGSYSPSYRRRRSHSRSPMSIAGVIRAPGTIPNQVDVLVSLG
ncbi:hypothetical protein GE061_015804 [Apolygus lucorum]|uniref:Uncharacterized protein n=1 Tax=Apolygus lucorum TaxID=248454 RepID=A0A8S9XP97_APOLU|nr:hypothetical protein GE061_015804 [Apolygus lucorum]